jgi:hypothetical protein
MRVRFLIPAAAVLMLAATPAIGKSPAQNARDSQGMANFYKQHGGQPGGRHINIFRHAHASMGPHRALRYR